jgi:ABC-type branched-subunit amino acid transport system ATPase component
MRTLQADSITAGYGKVPVVENVCVSASAGKVVALVGPNGAGKSTFLKAIFGLLRQRTGSVRVDGSELTGLPPHQVARRGMAYVPQVANVFASMTVSENLEIGAYTRKSGVRQRVDEVLGIFPDLAAARSKKAGNLSGGQRNMLAMARSLMLEPKVVLLDEPTAGLSPAYTSIVWEQVRRVAAAGTAVVVVEQNVDLAISHSDWVYVLVAGRNRLEGTAAEVAREDLPSIFLGGDGSTSSSGHTNGRPAGATTGGTK